jgi:hypothetical protein
MQSMPPPPPLEAHRDRKNPAQNPAAAHPKQAPSLKIELTKVQ